MIYQSDSYEKTIEIAESFGKKLKCGDIVCLTGDLGAGKTAFTKGIAKSKNVIYPVTSPTFSIINEYDGDIAIYHFDLYRLDSLADLDMIGFDDYIFSEGICVIEWPQIALSILPKGYYTVDLSYDNENFNYRRITIERS